MTRTTGRKELVKAGLESIAYQITDIVELMKKDAGVDSVELRADGGPTKNGYLMQLQSDLLNAPVLVSKAEELSCIGAAWAAGIGMKIFDQHVFSRNGYAQYVPTMNDTERKGRLEGWRRAVWQVVEAVSMT